MSIMIESLESLIQSKEFEILKAEQQYIIQESLKEMKTLKKALTDINSLSFDEDISTDTLISIADDALKCCP